MPLIIPGSNVRTIKESKGYTEASRLPMTLMFGQPNNAQKIDIKLESIETLTKTFSDILTERAQALDYVVQTTVNNIKSLFVLDSKLAYDIGSVPYTSLAPIQLPNIIGLKTNIYLYAQKIDTCLNLAIDILEYELAGLTKLVAQLLTNASSLISLRPISAVADLKLHTTDVEKEKGELANMIDASTQTEYITFGSIYYGLGDWKDCSRLALGINKRLNKVNLTRYGKDIKNTTVLMDKLLMRIDGSTIPKQNIEEYSLLIEQTSNNIGFAGAVIHMAQTLVQTLNNHNDILREEVADYKKHNKKK